MAKVGRPSKYKESFVETVEEYLTMARDPSFGDRLPKIVDLAIIFDVPEKTLYAWANDNPEFRKSLDKVKSEQQRVLIDRSLFDPKNTSSTIAKLLLMNNHGMSDKRDTDITSDGEKVVVGFNYIPNDKNTADN